MLRSTLAASSTEPEILTPCMKKRGPRRGIWINRPLRDVPRPRASFWGLPFNHWTGMVRTGTSGTAPVSASEKKSSRKVSERFELKSLSEIQYQVPRY